MNKKLVKTRIARTNTLEAMVCSCYCTCNCNCSGGGSWYASESSYKKTKGATNLQKSEQIL